MRIILRICQGIVFSISLVWIIASVVDNSWYLMIHGTVAMIGFFAICESLEH